MSSDNKTITFVNNLDPDQILHKSTNDTKECCSTQHAKRQKPQNEYDEEFTETNEAIKKP